MQQAIGSDIVKGISKIGVTSWGRCSRNLFHNKKRQTSGLTREDDFVVTGTKGSLLELTKQLESVYPIKGEHYRGSFDKGCEGAESENMLGRDRDFVST